MNRSELYVLSKSYPLFVNQVTDRKEWEWAAIRALAMQGSGTLHGLGFGVGTEPLPDWFREFGCTVLATDQSIDAPNAKEFWADTGQLLTEPDMIVDMNHIPESLHGKFDFCWSASSLDHLGSLANAKRFIHESVKCLKPGGRAVHTTEFAFSEQTVEEGTTVFFRLKDFEEFYPLATIDYSILKEPIDKWPYSNPNHLILESAGCIVTSCVLIIDKPL